MKTIKFLLFVLINVAIVSCNNIEHLGDPDDNMLSKYENTYISMVKFKEKSLNNHVLVYDGSYGSSPDSKLSVKRPPMMRAIDSLSSTHITNPYVSLRDDYYVVHWRWMGERGLIRIVNLYNCNGLYSCLDNYCWADMKTLSGVWTAEEERTLAPFKEVYHYSISDLDKSRGVYYYNYKPREDSLGRVIDDRVPFGVELPLTKENINWNIHKNDSVFDIYIMLLDSLIKNGKQTDFPHI